MNTGKKIFGLFAITLIVLSMTSIGVWAFFTDTETSQNNTVVAGTLDLKTNDADGVTQTLWGPDTIPGHTIGPATISLRNVGTIDGSTLDILFNYVENDGIPNSVNMTDNETAGVFQVITLTYGGDNLLDSVSDANNNHYTDLYDLKQSTPAVLGGIAAGASKDLVITVQLRGNVSTDYKADGITATLTVTLNQ